MRSRYFAMVASIGTSVCLSSTLHAQGVAISASLGYVSPSESYQSNCGHASVATSVAVQGTRRIFPQLSVDRFTGSGGGDVLCLRNGTGGLRLDGTTRLGLGVGVRIGSKWAGIEGALVGGFVSGRQGYTMAGAAPERVLAPQVGAVGTVMLLKHLLFTVALNRTRLATTESESGRTGSATKHAWSPMTTAQIGARFAIGAR